MSDMIGGDQLQQLLAGAEVDPPPHPDAGNQANLVKEIAQALHTGNATLNEMVDGLGDEVETALQHVKDGADSAKDDVAKALDSVKAAVDKLSEITTAHGTFLHEVSALGNMLRGAGQDVEASVAQVQQIAADLAVELQKQQEQLDKIHENLESAHSNLGG